MTRSSINLLPSEALAAYVKQRRFSIVSRLVRAVGILVLVVAVFVGAAWQYLVILTGSEEERSETARRNQAVQLERAEKAEEDLAALSQELRVLRELKK